MLLANKALKCGLWRECSTFVALDQRRKEGRSAAVGFVGSAPIDLSMIIPTSKTLTTDVSSQTLGSFIHTRTLHFNLSAKSSVLFSLSNLSTTNNKADYYFDSFYVGKVQEGPVELIESLGRRWGHTHAAPYYLREVADASATLASSSRSLVPIRSRAALPASATSARS